MNEGGIGPTEMTGMLQAACVEVISNESKLTELDSICGDGDHGATMARAAKAIQQQLREPDKTTGQVLMRAAGVFLSTDGGASCALLGAFFNAAAHASGEQPSLGPDELAFAFEQGLAGMRRYTKANVGDKTMMDALEPAVRALRDGTRRGIRAALADAARAAERGAQETKNMQAKIGRAQHLGARTVGYQDPGATTVGLLFAGFTKGINDG